MTFEGRVAIITGAGSGLGAVTAAALAAKGARVVLCGRRAAKVQSVRAEIEARGGTALAVAADVSKPEDVRRIVAETLAAFGRVDLLINNAAVFEPGDLVETTLESWNYQLAVNLTGAFLMTQAVLPSMRARKYGRIVNVTSALAANGSGGFAAYGVSKAGLEALGRTTAEDESTHGIAASLFNPGAIRSEMHATGRDPQAVVPELLKLLGPEARNGAFVDAASAG